MSKKENKIYEVCAIIDTAESYKLRDMSIWTDYYKTKEEAEEARQIAEDFYDNRAKVDCIFEVREIDLNHLSTIEKLKADLDEEYNECWNPEC